MCLVWLEQLWFLEPVVDTLEEEEEEDESVERISKFHQSPNNCNKVTDSSNSDNFLLSNFCPLI